MKPTRALLTCAMLVCGSSAFAIANAIDVGSNVIPGAATIAAAEDFEALSTAYDKAVAEHKAKMKDADRDARKALRKEKPINAFWPKFEALAETNDGQALLWMADNMSSYRGIKKKDRAKALAPIFNALVEHHAEAKWFEGTFAAIAANAKSFDAKALKSMFDTGIENAKVDSVKAAGLFHASVALKKSDAKAADAYMARILEEYPKSFYATSARAANAKPEDSIVGKSAPDFAGRSIDGFEFNLEDYRGKVVLLDFYGFW